jgi:hypothetical protein
LSTVVPSQIVEFIDTMLLYFLGEPRSIKLSPPICGALRGLLRLIDQLPGALYPSKPQTYGRFIQSQESIRFTLQLAENQEAYAMAPQLAADEVQIIRDALATCPDEFAPIHSTELVFIQDQEFRKTLLIDLEAARSALSHAERRRYLLVPSLRRCFSGQSSSRSPKRFRGLVLVR